ncbi:MAG: hypothetical protein D6790_06825, partial [Caldilineae bacterium]
AYSEHLLSIALLALPVQLSSSEPLLAYNLSLLVSYPLAAYGMYLLMLYGTRRRDAAFIAGLIFGFASYRFAALGHMQLLHFQWLPFAVLRVERFMRGGGSSSGARTGLATFLVFLLLQLLASWYLAVFAGLILGLHLIAMLLQGRAPLRRTALLLGMLAAVGLLMLPLALPYVRLLDSLREARPLSFALSLAAAPTDFAAAPPFNRLFGPLTASLRGRPGFTPEHTLFLGAAAPALALVALATCTMKRRRCPGFFLLPSLAAVLAVSFLLTFPGPYAVLAHLFPPTTVVRAPARWVIPGLFGLAGLAGLGSAYLLSKLTSPRRRGMLLSLICLLLVAESWAAPIPLAQVDNRQSLNPVYRYLARQPQDFVLVELPLHAAPAPEYPEGKRLYASTLGWWPLVNGYSGYTPPRQMELGRALSNFPDPQAVAALQELAGSFQPRRLLLLVHPDEAPFNRPAWEESTRWQVEKNPAFLPLGRFRGDDLYQVQPPSSPWRRLAAFGDPPLVELVGLRLVDQTHQPSPAVVETNRALVLYWRALARLEIDWTVFVHLRAADGFVRSQADGPPVHGRFPTSSWESGVVVQDIHPLPQEDWSQVDHLFIGLYDPATGAREPAFGPDGRRLPDDGFTFTE